MEVMLNLKCHISLCRIRSSSCSTNNRNNSIKFPTYKCHGYSKILFSSPSLAWPGNNCYTSTRKFYMGAVLASQGNDVQPSDATAGPSNEKPWGKWLIGVILSLVLPFVTNKWCKILTIKNEVDTVVNTVETAAEAVEKVAEEVAHVAEEVANSLPEGGTMQNIVCNIANVAEETAKDAHAIDQFIEKVEDVEQEIISSIVGGEHKTTTHEIEVDEVITKDNDIQFEEEVELKHEKTKEEVPQYEIIDDQPKSLRFEHQIMDDQLK